MTFISTAKNGMQKGHNNPVGFGQSEHQPFAPEV
jgi:hypothetical protein